MPSLSKYLKRFDSNSVLIVSNVQNSTDIGEAELELSRELIQSKILFQHMVSQATELSSNQKLI